MEKLSNEELEQVLSTLNGWNYENPFIEKKF